MNDSVVNQLLQKYQSIRSKTQALCQPLDREDYVIQSCDDVSPPKWHLAHTTWFFEMFMLIPHLPNYREFDPLFLYLFNSEYNGAGPVYPREKRGLLTRPTIETVNAYRQHVDNHMIALITRMPSMANDTFAEFLELGLNHEQQHQELLLMDIKYNYSMNPHYPVYRPALPKKASNDVMALEFNAHLGGMVEVGNPGHTFCYDNELPQHQRFQHPYAIANRLVTNQEYADFIAAGGYTDPQWWLSDGWLAVQQHKWEAPLYWQRIENEWYYFTLSGLQKMDPSAPVVHVSYFEADAYARWKGKRLPLEEEWEHAVDQVTLKPTDGNVLEKWTYQPQAATQKNPQYFGDVWEWTASSYSPYPGFKPVNGVAAEYNQKFMNNQKVLRGGSCVTPGTHIRSTYRNYFSPEKRWQFSGIRLAQDSL